jgi:hypothetical protein
MTRSAATALLLAAAGAGRRTLADYDYENLTFRGIGFDVGYIWPTRWRRRPSISLRLDLGYLGPAVRIAPTHVLLELALRRRELERLADRLSSAAGCGAGVVITARTSARIDWSDLSLAWTRTWSGRRRSTSSPSSARAWPARAERPRRGHR